MVEYKVVDNGLMWRKDNNVEWTLMSMPEVVNYICKLQADVYEANARKDVLAEELVEIRRWGQDIQIRHDKKIRCLNTIVGTLNHYAIIPKRS